MNNTNLPWKDETEFFQLHSKRIFSQHKMYNSAVMGDSPEDFAEYIRKNARIRFLGKVLDLGCGSGFMVHSFSHIADCMGISTSSACIKQCRDNYPESNFQLGDMASFVYPKATNILAMESLFYSDVPHTLETSWNNLVPGGYLFIYEICKKEGLSQDQEISFESIGNFWKYYPQSVSYVIGEASKVGFQLVEFQDVSNRRNMNFFLETLPLLEIPDPDPTLSQFLLSAQFLFKKPGFHNSYV
ncbi:MAG: class I SAM-dependent methyltransferase [Bacteroidota bacterium]